MYYRTSFPSPLGTLTLACDQDHLVGVWLEGQKYHGATVRLQEIAKCDDLPVFSATKQWLDRYFAKMKPEINELPLRPTGSMFRQDVWRILCDIPYGETATYSEIAKKMAARLGRTHMSSQAVGGAVGHNPISIIIPCHRVIGANGSLTGYAGGIEVKQKLLELEGVDTAKLFIPKQVSKK